MLILKCWSLQIRVDKKHICILKWLKIYFFSNMMHVCCHLKWYGSLLCLWISNTNFQRGYWCGFLSLNSWCKWGSFKLLLLAFSIITHSRVFIHSRVFRTQTLNIITQQLEVEDFFLFSLPNLYCDCCLEAIIVKLAWTKWCLDKSVFEQAKMR